MIAVAEPSTAVTTGLGPVAIRRMRSTTMFHRSRFCSTVRGAISALPELEELQFTGCRTLPSAGLKLIDKLPKLTDLRTLREYLEEGLRVWLPK